MPNPAPVLRLVGTVQSGPTERIVPPTDAQPAQYDDAGNFLRAAREARPGYTCWDYTILTDGGGFTDLVIRDQALGEAGPGFTKPALGDKIDLPVRGFDSWQTANNGRSYRRTAYSLAGALVAASAGRRASVTAVS